MCLRVQLILSEKMNKWLSEKLNLYCVTLSGDFNLKLSLILYWQRLKIPVHVYVSTICLMYVCG